MTDRQKPCASQNHAPPASSAPYQIGDGNAKNGDGKCSGKNGRFPNPPERTIPDPTTLREQWRYAIKQYSRMYSHAWGTAIFAGLSFFALGWIVKGSNPLPSFKTDESSPSSSNDADQARK